MFWGEFARSWPIESARRCTVADGISGLAWIDWETLVQLSHVTCHFGFHIDIAQVVENGADPAGQLAAFGLLEAASGHPAYNQSVLSSQASAATSIVSKPV